MSFFQAFILIFIMSLFTLLIILILSIFAPIQQSNTDDINFNQKWYIINKTKHLITNKDYEIMNKIDKKKICSENDKKTFIIKRDSNISVKCDKNE